jgi:hypothetical protein
MVIPSADRAVYEAVVMRDIYNGRGDVAIGKGSPAELIGARDGRLALRSVMAYGNVYRVRPPDAEGPVPLDGPAHVEAESIVAFQAGESFVLRPLGAAQ